FYFHGLIYRDFYVNLQLEQRSNATTLMERGKGTERERKLRMIGRYEGQSSFVISL
ncbi:hypothetical protein HMPREF3034_01777, partial [Prevotella sp. DNF00663]